MRFLPLLILLIVVLGCSAGSDTGSSSGSNSAPAVKTGSNSAPASKSGQVEVKVPEVGLSWQIPADWTELPDCGRGDAGCKAYYISPDHGGSLEVKYEVQDDDTSPDDLLQQLYEGGLKGKENGNYADVKKSSIGGLQGIEITGAKPAQRDFMFETVVRSQGKVYFVAAGTVGTGDWMNRQDELLKIFHSMTQSR